MYLPKFEKFEHQHIEAIMNDANYPVVSITDTNGIRWILSRSGYMVTISRTYPQTCIGIDKDNISSFLGV